MGTILEDKDYVDLSALPRYGKRGIEWRQVHHVPVRFRYRGVEDVLFVEKHISQDYVLISYKGIEYRLAKICLQRCALGKLFNFACANNYKYQVGDILTLPNKPSIKILEQIRQSDGHSRKGAKSYRVQCLTCQNIFNMREGNIGKGDRCPYCSNHRVKVGFNDVAHTNPELIPYFANEDDAFRYVSNSNQRVDTVCPVCNTSTGKRSVYDLSQHHIRCPMCGKGTSYPNRFMFNLLQELHMNVETEVMFDWCVFPDDQNTMRNVNGRYDFVLNDIKTIIEMDSGLGHGRNIHSKANTTKESDLYRDRQKEVLAKQHGYTVMRVNCEYYGHQDRFVAVKQGILRSKLPTIINLSNINWSEIDKMSQSSLLKDICDYYLSGYSVSEIAKIYKLTIPTIRVYLHKGEDCGLCTYGYKKTNRR